MDTKPRISLAIATYNRARFLPGLFESIEQQSLPISLFEVLLIDNNSSDNTEQLCKEFMERHPQMHIRYMVETNQGLSYGRNRGIAEAQGEYISFGDDDALLQPDYLEKVVAFFDTHPTIGEVGGAIYLNYLCPVPKWGNKYMDSLFGYYLPSDKPFVMKGKKQNYPRGGNMSFRMDCLQAIGGFNVALGRTKESLLGGEEKDVAFRLIDYGVLVGYSPDIVVRHCVPEERTTEQFIERQAVGTGYGERIRTKQSGEFGKRLLVEAVKWAGTLVLATGYTLRMQPEKGCMLIKFRYWISCGLLGIKRNF
ncbi:MAG: glycosyltransferase [Marinifilaceae bacterium]